jgi:hypothetical protein
LVQKVILVFKGIKVKKASKVWLVRWDLLDQKESLDLLAPKVPPVLKDCAVPQVPKEFAVKRESKDWLVQSDQQASKVNQVPKDYAVRREIKD